VSPRREKTKMEKERKNKEIEKRKHECIPLHNYMILNDHHIDLLTISK
jgi:hypothetical protein